MKITMTTDPLEKVSAEALVVLHEDGGVLGSTESEALRGHFDAFTKAVEKKKSKRGWFCTLEKDAETATQHLLLDSVTFNGKAPHDEPLKTTAARAVALCRDHSISKIAFAVHHKLAAMKAAAILEGVILGDFLDDRFKGKQSKRPPLQLTFAVPAEEKKAVKETLARTQVVAEAANSARELVNAPHHALTPAEMAKYAQKLAKTYKMKCTVLDEKQIKREGYELLYQVGRGSEYPPRMIIMKYEPKRRDVREHVALVGKGMTFDTGGLCLKGRDSIYKMNFDMGGAAAVLGAMEAIARLKLPVRVTAIIGSAHNAVDGAAYTPGCIIKTKGGKSVHVENTDAEGRLVLADCFTRAGEEKAEVMIDFATLTGACIMALGPNIAGLFTDDETLRTVLMRAAGDTGDDLWPLPLVREYEAGLKHHLADTNNMSSIKMGGAIHAANFLKQFVPKGMRWAHVDIAGPASVESKFRYYNKGATGYGVRLAVGALQLMQETEL